MFRKKLGLILACCFHTLIHGDFFFDQQVGLAEDFPCLFPWRSTWPCCRAESPPACDNRMSYGRKEARMGNKYLPRTECAPAWMQPECALCQIRLVNNLHGYLRRVGEGKCGNGCSVLAPFSSHHSYSSLPVSDSCKPWLSLLMQFAVWWTNKSDKSPQVQKVGGGGHYLLFLMRCGICLFTTPLCVLTWNTFDWGMINGIQ